VKLIETKTLTVAAASIEFTSIPQDGTDLVMVFSVRTNRADNSIDSLNLSFNGSLLNRTNRTLASNGAGGSTSNTDTNLYWTNGNTGTANTFGSGQIYIPNYTASTNKSVSIESISESNDTSQRQAIQGMLWSQTTAISSLGLAPISSTQLLTGSVFSLYKITKGSDGIVTVS
jgi:hypothetical protein